MKVKDKSINQYHYIDGNVVRHYNIESDNITYIEKDNTKIERVKLRESIAISQWVCMLLAIVLVVYTSINCIIAQNNFKNSINELGMKKNLLETLTVANEQIQVSIDTQINLEEIYKVATTELGMVYPSENQIINYEKSENEYIRQYDDISEY